MAAACRGRDTPNTERGLPLCVAKLPESAWRVPARRSDVVLQGALEALSDAERLSLRAALAAASDQWEVRANPLVEALDLTADPDVAMSSWQRTAPQEPAVALSLVKWRYCGSDGLCVEPRVGASCSPGFRAPSSDKEGERARGLAWPYGYAAVLTLAQLGDRMQFAKDCRARFGACLVVDPSAKPTPDTQSLMDSYKRYEALRLVAREGAKAAPEASELPWLPAEGQVLVVPGLRVLGEEPAFRAFIAARKSR
jgi:hypothetical protein